MQSLAEAQWSPRGCHAWCARCPSSPAGRAAPHSPQLLSVPAVLQPGDVTGAGQSCRQGGGPAQCGQQGGARVAAASSPLNNCISVSFLSLSQ